MYRFAYVHTLFSGGIQVGVRWLTLPSRTICDGRPAGSIPTRPATFYPIGNELFWSDRCNCHHDPTCRIISVHTISAHQDHARPGDELFVHRQYPSKDLAIHEISTDEVSRCMKHDSTDNPTPFSNTSMNLEMKRSPTGAIGSLFSSCGLLDRGFETGAGGAFETVLAVDCDHAALSSFQANHPRKEACDFHNLEVNSLFNQFARGDRPLPHLCLLIAGCPCQGFSTMNPKKDNDKSRKTALCLLTQWHGSTCYVLR